MPPTPNPPPVVNEDQLDDLIYASRTGDLASLTSLITSISQSHACSPATLLAAAIDIDSDGLGSGSSLLHYSSANGNLEVVEYLLGLLSPDQGQDKATEAETETSPSTTSKTAKALHPLLNHKNTSGNTPLHWSSLNGHLSVVKALLSAGADPSIRNEAGRDCIVEAEIAAGNGREGARECADYMEKTWEGLESGEDAEVGETEEDEEQGTEGGETREDETNGAKPGVNGLGKEKQET